MNGIMHSQSRKEIKSRRTRTRRKRSRPRDRQPLTKSTILIAGSQALIILLFGFGYAARYVHPVETWWFQLIAVGLPLLSVLVLVLVIRAAIKRTWKEAIFFFAIFLLALIRFIPFQQTQSPSKPGLPGGTLNLLSFNFLRAATSIDLRSDGQAVRADLGGKIPDIVALQETPIQFFKGSERPVIPASVSNLIDAALYTSKRPVNLSGEEFFQPIIARVPIDSIAQIPILIDRRQGAEYMTRAELTWNDRKIAVYNLHLHSYNKSGSQGGEWWNPFDWLNLLRIYKDDFLIRADQAVQIRRMLDAEQLPVIVCGDFNSTPDQWVYRHLKGDLFDIMDARGYWWNATYPSGIPIIRIDYMLVSDEFFVEQALVHSTKNSDHRAITGSLRIRD